MKLIVFLLGLTLSQTAMAFKVLVFTDQRPARDAYAQLKRFDTPPFNEFNIAYEVRYVPTATLGCGPTSLSIEGMVECDNEYINRWSQRLNADQTIIVPSIGTRASGGSLSIIPVGRPSGSMLHEFLHAFGFNDEYEYNKKLAKIYCKKERIKNVSLAAFEAKNPYSSDANAKLTHLNDVSWFRYIKTTTPITTVTSRRILSTPMTHQGSIGVFKSHTCNKASPPLTIWKPGHASTIMEFHSRNLGPAQVKIVRDILIAKGVPLKSAADSEEVNIPAVINSTRSVPGTVLPAERKSLPPSIPVRAR